MLPQHYIIPIFRAASGEKEQKKRREKWPNPRKSLLTVVIVWLVSVEYPWHDSLGLSTMAHRIRFGVYDFEQVLTDNRQFGTEHIFVSWKDYKNGSLTDQLNVIRSRGPYSVGYDRTLGF